MKETH